MRRTSMLALTVLLLASGCARQALPQAAGLYAAAPAAMAKETRREKAIRVHFTGRFNNNEDRNKDGKITKDEWPYIQEAFKRADTNNDGAIDLEEYLEDSKFAAENQTRTHESGFKILLERVDRNHDGKILGKELVYRPNQHATIDYNTVDFNKDGEFTMDEYVDAHWNLNAGLKPALPF